MADVTLEACLVKNKYKYQEQLSPVENYQYFHQAISFGRGVEFVSDLNLLEKFELILFDLPGIDCDIKRADLEFKAFYRKLDNQINQIINSETNAFEIYASVYDLFKELKDDLNSNAPEDISAIERILEFPIAEWRKKKTPLVKGTRKGALTREIAGCNLRGLDFESLPVNLQEYIFKYITLRHKHKEKFFHFLSERITWLFNKKEFFKHYQFDGEVADIIEIAIVLHPKVKSFGKKRVTLEQLARDLGLLLGQTFSRVADQKNTLVARRAKDNLYFKDALMHLRKYIDSM